MVAPRETPRLLPSCDRPVARSTRSAETSRFATVGKLFLALAYMQSYTRQPRYLFRARCNSSLAVTRTCVKRRKREVRDPDGLSQRFAAATCQADLVKVQDQRLQSGWKNRSTNTCAPPHGAVAFSRRRVAFGLPNVRANRCLFTPADSLRAFFVPGLRRVATRERATHGRHTKATTQERKRSRRRGGLGRRRCWRVHGERARREPRAESQRA